jgi:hypothetical protein
MLSKLNGNARRVAATTAVLASVSALVVAAHPIAATSSTATAQTITFTARGSTFHEVDVAPKGETPTPNDSFVVTSKLFRAGERIGTLHAQCVVTRRAADPARTPLLCQGVYKFKDGTITGTALLSANPISRVAVTGGTGAYAGASGTATEVPTENENRVRVTITLE